MNSRTKWLGAAVLTSVCALYATGVAFAADPTHCRKPTDQKYQWRVVPSTNADFVSPLNKHWQIVSDYRPGVPAAISIEEKDRFEITDSGGLKLVHLKSVQGNYEPFARADLTLGGGGLWASGDAKLESSKQDVGEYFVYQLPMRDSTHGYGKCKYPGATSASCRSLHFEYFDDQDSAVQKDKPKIGVNVVEQQDPALCKHTGDQTDDGDGDLGP